MVLSDDGFDGRAGGWLDDAGGETVGLACAEWEGIGVDVVVAWAIMIGLLSVRALQNGCQPWALSFHVPAPFVRSQGLGGDTVAITRER